MTRSFYNLRLLRGGHQQRVKGVLTELSFEARKSFNLFSLRTICMEYSIWTHFTAPFTRKWLAAVVTKKGRAIKLTRMCYLMGILCCGPVQATNRMSEGFLIDKRADSWHAKKSLVGMTIAMTYDEFVRTGKCRHAFPSSTGLTLSL